MLGGYLAPGTLCSECQLAALPNKPFHLGETFYDDTCAG